MMANNGFEHPDITRLQIFGVQPTSYPECPWCGADAEIFYKQNGLVIGCCECIESVGWDELAERD